MHLESILPAIEELEELRYTEFTGGKSSKRESGIRHHVSSALRLTHLGLSRSLSNLAEELSGDGLPLSLQNFKVSRFTAQPLPAGLTERQAWEMARHHDGSIPRMDRTLYVVAKGAVKASCAISNGSENGENGIFSGVSAFIFNAWEQHRFMTHGSEERVCYSIPIGKGFPPILIV